jgi:NDP-sugar pyrophosphorylase family protein
MAAFHVERAAMATLALARPRIPWGAVETNEFGHVLDFVESPPSPFLINAGVYVFDPGFTHLLPERGDHERTTFPELAAERRLAGFRHEGTWLTVNTPKQLRLAEEFVNSHPEWLAA